MVVSNGFHTVTAAYTVVRSRSHSISVLVRLKALEKRHKSSLESLQISKVDPALTRSLSYLLRPIRATPQMAQAAERPILKRRRTDSVSPPRDTYIRDERFWYPDGNIIIVAQGVAFRVFKSILAEDSEVFRDMFQLPTPASNPSQSAAFLNPAEDCPVVHVTDTDAEFRSLLDVLLRGKQ